MSATLPEAPRSIVDSVPPAKLSLESLLPAECSTLGAPALVDALLAATYRLGASDLHLLPTETGLRVAWRVDGVLHPAGELAPGVSANVVARFKVLADLLTYETQTPQEGRLQSPHCQSPIRVSTIPTIFGEKLVARVLPTGRAELGSIDALGLPPDVAQLLTQASRQTSGLIVIAGPAGSGKTTTGYATIRAIQDSTNGARSITSLEDPVEVVLPGVAQSQAAPHAGFDLVSGLRALVRQDPEVIFLGEIRDAQTARLAYQAALTGQLVVTTFHAGDAAESVSRLIDMGVPPYVVRGATRAIIAQRLMRRRCATCNGDQASHCSDCRGAGYRGRLVVAEAIDLSQAELSRAVVEGVDQHTLREVFASAGVCSLKARAGMLVADGSTTRLEAERVLGVGASLSGQDESR